jgi:hypothetical protein
LGGVKIALNIKELLHSNGSFKFSSDKIEEKVGPLFCLIKSNITSCSLRPRNTIKANNYIIHGDDVRSNHHPMSMEIELNGSLPRKRQLK